MSTMLIDLRRGSPVDGKLETRELKGASSGGDPPLPIPNREVKPIYADGSAVTCVRVGSRRFSKAFTIFFVKAFLLYTNLKKK